MDKNIKIQLGSTKNVNSTDVDTYDNLILENQRNNLLEYNIRNVLSATDIFNAERQSTEIYRIYGGIEYFSILNGLYKEYKYINEIFRPTSYREFEYTNMFKTIYNSFNFYLLKPNGYIKLNDTDNEYVSQFEVIATPDNFEIFNAGYSRNLFNEPKYAFIFNKDFDISNWVDGFGFPITELYLFPKYNRASNSHGYESMSATTWSNDGSEDINPYTVNDFNMGDIVYGNKISYQKSEFLQTNVSSQVHYISTQYTRENVTSNADFGNIIWKYEPFIPLKLRYLSNEISRANTGDTSHEQTSEIPYYATHLGDGNMVWREILEQGYIDPLTGEGVDYPFINKRRYLFSNLIINIIPHITPGSKTEAIFNEIKFDDPSTLNYNPLGNLNQIGQPCQ